MIFRRLALAVFTVFLLPAGASAATFGPDLTASQVNTNTGGLAYVPVVNTDHTTHTGAPFAGVLTKVRVQAGASVAATGRVTVMRQTTPWSSGEATFLKVSQQLVNVSVDTSLAGHISEIPMRVAINAGDVVGLDNIDANLRIFASYGGGPADHCAFSFVYPAVGDSTVFGTSTCNQALPMVQGTVEPDADGDGFGDETQDLCPTDASRQTACLTPATIVLKAVRSSSKTASSASRSFTLTNTGQLASALVPFSIKSSKKVKNLRIVKGCVPASKKKPTSCSIPSIAPGATVTIKVSLSIKAATKTTLTASSGALKATSTVKLKAKKK